MNLKNYILQYLYIYIIFFIKFFIFRNNKKKNFNMSKDLFNFVQIRFFLFIVYNKKQNYVVQNV